MQFRRDPAEGSRRHADEQEDACFIDSSVEVHGRFRAR